MLKLTKIIMTAVVIAVILITSVAMRDWIIAAWAFASMVVGAVLCIMWGLKSVNE